MSDEQSGSNLWLGVFAVIGIAVVGFFLFRQTKSDSNVPEINMSREELMRGAMVDGPGQAVPEAPASKDPKTIAPKKGAANLP